MGVDRLLLDLRKHYAVRSHISHFKGKTLGVDISCLFYRLLSTKSVRDHYCSFPSRPVKDVVVDIQELCELAKTHDVKLIFVFDGKRHPLKQGEDQRRL